MLERLLLATQLQADETCAYAHHHPDIGTGQVILRHRLRSTRCFGLPLCKCGAWNGLLGPFDRRRIARPRDQETGGQRQEHPYSYLHRAPLPPAGVSRPVILRCRVVAPSTSQRPQNLLIRTGCSRM